MAFHPQSDGMTEQFNQEVEAYLGIYCSSNPADWHKKIGTAEFTHNNQRHSDRTRTPFELMFGTSPLAIPTAFEHTKFPAVEDKIKALQKDREGAIATHELARRRMAERRKTFNLDRKCGWTPATSKPATTGKWHPNEKAPSKSNGSWAPSRSN